MKIKLTTKVLHGCLLMSFSASTLAGVQNTKINTSLVPTLEGDPKVDFQLARVGWHLFRDPKLSSNGKISCETCHNLSTNGAEQTQVSTGVHGVGTRNSISVFNAALNYRFLWDGTANSLMAQIDGPVQNHLEMDSNWEEIEKYVQANSLYKSLFGQADNRINVTNIKLAIVEFVKGLQTRSSPFDAYLRGDTDAMNEQSIRGWTAFQQVGCVQCHQGRNIGGSMIQ